MQSTNPEKHEHVKSAFDPIIPISGRNKSEPLWPVESAENSIDGGSQADIANDPISVARYFIESFDRAGNLMIPRCEHLFSEQFVFEVAGNAKTSPLAGVFNGLDEFQNWLDLFHRTYARGMDKEIRPDVFLNSNHVIARFVEVNLAFENRECRPIWFDLFFDIRNGRIQRVRVEHNSFTDRQVLVSCRQNMWLD